MRATRVQPASLPGRNLAPSSSPAYQPRSLLPFRIGAPPASALCPAGTPPDGFDFLGAVATVRCWMFPCPACCDGWVGLVPDGTQYGYRIASDVGCSAGCGGADIAWWQLWRLACLPPQAVDPVTWRGRAYAKAVLRRLLADLPSTPSEADLRRTAFQLGRWLEAGGLSADLVAPGLLAAGERAGLPRATIAPALAAAVTAGRADPARVPQ